MTPLETTFTFRNMDSTEALKEHTLKKLKKIGKYLVNQNAIAHMVFKVEGPRHLAEVTLNVKGKRYFGTETSSDMYASVEGAIHRLESQLSKDKERVTRRKGK
ncbi:MAG TPA: ribosome-associated translation inhibitor RaiA [bacterium]|nr:ribosome-associated translation inhibitor RaiA [Myxococcales bacterium]HPW45651.1 ribosome-associated translation inhibitor RaiA [bacterium]